jgi:hypothetical protein
LENSSKVDYQGFYFTFHVENITVDEAKSFEERNNLIASVYDMENMIYYADGEYPSINLFEGKNSKM